jgi:hypothetical protein
VTDPLKPKGKPRGRPFQRGADARRYGSESLGLYGDQKEQLQQMQRQTERALGALNHNGHPKGETMATMAPPDAGQRIATLFTELAQAVAPPVDEAKVREIVEAERAKWVPDLTELQRLAKEAAAAVEPKTLRLEIATGDEVKVKTLDGLRHAVTETVLQRFGAGFRNVLLVGPGGSGKTTLAHRIADAMDLPFASVSCSAGMSEGVLLGRLLPTGEGGRFEYAVAPFVKCYEEGGVFLLDEVDAADANVLLVLNSAIANGHLDVPNRLDKPVAKRHPRFYLLAAGNTWGLGANRQYVGRNQLDAAFLDRFAGAVLEMPYDRKLERGIAVGILGDAVGVEWAERIWAIRDRIESTGLRRIWGTRALVNGGLLLKAGMTQTATLQALTVGWTADELTKAGVA